MRSLLAGGPPSLFVPTAHLKTTAELKWAELQLMRTLGGDIPDYRVETDALVEGEFAQLKDKSVRNLRAAAAEWERSPSDPQKCVQFSGAFLTFIRKFPSLGDYFIPKYESMFQQMPIDLLFANHRFAAFNLFPTVKRLDLLAMDFSYTNSKEFEEFFQVPFGVTNPELFRHVQNQIIAQHCYPECPPYETDRVVRSLIGTTILNSRHFIDRIRILSKQFYDLDDYAEAYRIACSFQKIGMWIFASHAAKDFGSTFHKFAASLQGVPESSSMITNFVQRNRNDERFVGMLRVCTGQILSFDEMRTKSVPLHLLQFMLTRNQTPFLEFSATPLFCISDDDRVTDCDFVWCFFAMDTLIRIIEAPSLDITLVEELENLVRRVDNQLVKEGVVTDLFSLVFLRTDHFICDLEKAEMLITSLMSFSTQKEFVRCGIESHLHLQLAKLVAQGKALDNAFTPVRILLYESLKGKDWQKVDFIASVSPRDAPFVRAFRTVQEFRADGTLDVASADRLALNEIALCFPRQKSLIDPTHFEAEAATLLARRQEAVSDKHMKCLKSLKAAHLQPVLAKLSGMTSVSWEVPSLTKSFRGLPTFTSFINYLDNLLPVLLKGRVVDSVGAALKMNPYQTLHELLCEQKAQEAKDLAALLQLDLSEILVRDSSYSPALVARLVPDHPVVALAAVLTSPQAFQADLVPGGSVCGRLYSKRRPGDPSDAAIATRFLGAPKCKPGTGLSWTVMLEVGFGACQDGVDEQSVMGCIRSLILDASANIEAICELSFSVSSSAFSELLLKSASNDNIAALGQIIRKAVVEPATLEKLEFLAELDREGIPPFPLEGSLHRILLQKNFIRAARFMASFEEMCDVFSVLLEYVRTCEDTLDVYLIAGKIKPRLLKELGVGESDLGSLFLDAIPRSWWLAGASPESILASHFATEFERVVDILKSFKQIDLDKVFIEHLDSVVDAAIPDVVARVTKFLPACRDVPQLIDSVLPRFEAKINSLCVTDEASEDLALNSLLSIQALVHRTEPTLFSQKVDLLRSIVDHHPQAMHGFSYSFANFGIELYNLCHSIDLFSLMPRMAELWDIPLSKSRELIEDTFVRLCKFSIYEMPFDWEPPESVWSQVLALIGHLNLENGLPAFVQKSFPPTGELPKEPCFYDFVHRHATVKAIEPDLTGLLKLFDGQAPVEIQARCYSQLGQFDNAIALLGKIERESVRMDVFRQEILSTAIGHNMFDSLKNAMIGHDELFRAMDFVAGPNLKYYIEDHLGRHRSAAQIAIRLFTTCRYLQLSLSYLEAAELSIDKIEAPSEEDFQLLRAIALQRQYSVAAKGQLLTLFSSSADRVTIVLWLLIAGDCRLAVEIIGCYNMDTSEVGEKLLDLVFTEKGPAVLEHLNKLQFTLDTNFFHEILHAILLRMAFDPVQNRSELVYDVIRMMTDLEFRTKLFIEYGYVEEAANLALEHGFKHLIPLIGNMAQYQYKTAVVAKCMKVMMESVKGK